MKHWAPKYMGNSHRGLLERVHGILAGEMGHQKYTWGCSLAEAVSAHSSSLQDSQALTTWRILFAYPKSAFRENRTPARDCKLEFHSSLSLSVCDNLENFTSGSPFLCMDLSYITALLKDGFGFADSTVLQVREDSTELQNSLLIWELGKGLVCVVIRVAAGGIMRGFY